MKVGGWELAPMKACDLPEVVATGFNAVVKGLVGAKYIPVLYCGSQVVNGTNHMIICEQTLATAEAEKHIVKLVLNASADPSKAAAGEGFTLVSIETII